MAPKRGAIERRGCAAALRPCGSIVARPPGLHHAGHEARPIAPERPPAWRETRLSSGSRAARAGAFIVKGRIGDALVEAFGREAEACKSAAREAVMGRSTARTRAARPIGGEFCRAQARPERGLALEQHDIETVGAARLRTGPTVPAPAPASSSVAGPSGQSRHARREQHGIDAGPVAVARLPDVSPSPRKTSSVGLKSLRRFCSRSRSSPAM